MLSCHIRFPAKPKDSRLYSSFSRTFRFTISSAATD